MTYQTYKVEVRGEVFSIVRCNLRELVRVIDYFVSRLIQRRLYMNRMILIRLIYLNEDKQLEGIFHLLAHH